MKRQNNITKKDYSDEWFTDQSTVDLVVSLLNPSGSICCPFDSSKSLFVKSANLIGKAIYGMTDWLEVDYDYDYLMTNPPFSIKDLVIEKVIRIGKPSALVLPLDSVGGVRRHQIYAKGQYPAVYIPTRRINNYDAKGVKRKGAYFHIVILLFNTNREGIIWESKTYLQHYW